MGLIDAVLTKARIFGVGAAVTLTVFGQAAATHYHVAPSGRDGNAGTLAAPFLTIAKASSLLTAGDTCTLHAGTYRETIKPANSGSSGKPILYRAAGDGKVYISGADSIGGWSVYQGSVYQASTTIDRGARKNQVFVDRQMMVEARWPNVPWSATKGFDLLEAPLAKATIDSGSATMSVPSATQTAGFWNGAYLWAEIGVRWTEQTATIGSSSPGNLTLTAKSSPWFPDAFGKTYTAGGIFITGTLAALDTVGEWYLQSGKLYLMTVDRSNPAAHLVEARNGRLVADLTGKNWIVVSGISGYGGAVTVTGANCRIENCTFRSVSHDAPAGYGSTGGLTIGGSANSMVNCLIDGSSSDAVKITGTGDTLRNCIVRNVDYNGDYGRAVNLDGSLNTVEYCTMTHSGRCLVNPAGTKQTIVHNDLANPMRFTLDGGHFYGWHVESQGTVIAYNKVHDLTDWALGVSAVYWQGGIYIDDGSRDFIIHHNVVWNSQAGIKLNHNESSGWTVSGHRAFNNTLIDNVAKGVKYAIVGGGTAAFTDIQEWNNLSDSTLYNGTDLQKNLYTTVTNAKFTNAAARDYTLMSGSPAIDYGVLISGITDGYTGNAPDAGAFEFGVPAWKAGADSTTVGADLGGGTPVITVSAAPATSRQDVRGEVRLFDVCGRTVHSVNQPMGGKFHIGLNRGPAGVYFLTTGGHHGMGCLAALVTCLRNNRPIMDN